MNKEKTDQFANKASRVYQSAVDNIFNTIDPTKPRRGMTSVPFLKSMLTEEFPSEKASICNNRSASPLSSEPTITYNGTLSSESLLKAAFGPTPRKAMKERPNVCIVGAGPVGLYMSVLLKHLAPSLDIVVVEKRATTEGARQLTRDKELYIPGAFLSRTRLFPSFPDPAADVATIEDALTRLCSPLYELLHTDGGLHLFAFLDRLWPAGITKETVTKGIRINRLEHELAKAAQAKGVRIYHDNKITDLESVVSAYTNKDTLAVFDATGGRLVPVEFPLVATYVPPSTLPAKKLDAEHRAERRVPIYEGHLDPEVAVSRIPGRSNLLYVPIGDTFMKVDPRGASPGTVNGMVVCLGLALAFVEALGPVTNSGRKRTTRRSSSSNRRSNRKTRSASF